MNSILLRYRSDRHNTEKRRAALRNVPQRPISASEIISYAILPFMLIMCGTMPSTALFFLPIALSFLFVLYRRFGLYFPLSCIAVYGVVALTVNYDILSVVYFCGLFASFCGLVLGAQYTHYLAYMACAALLAIVGSLCGVGIVRLAEGAPIEDISERYVLREKNDPFISFLSREYYDDLKLPADMIKLDPTDPNYAQAAAESFAEYVSDELNVYVWYYCIHYGAVIAAFGFFVSVALCRKTSSCNDVSATMRSVMRSTRALGGVGAMKTPVSAMRMPRSYLWSCVLPAVLASMALEFIGGYDQLSATVMHTFATLPSAFACLTLLAFFASLFNGKAKTVAYGVVCLIGVAAFLFPIVLFALSVLGICDCILNLRFWVNFIKED